VTVQEWKRERDKCRQRHESAWADIRGRHVTIRVAEDSVKKEETQRKQ
jgi:hypothetical protein